MKKIIMTKEERDETAKQLQEMIDNPGATKEEKLILMLAKSDLQWVTIKED